MAAGMEKVMGIQTAMREDKKISIFEIDYHAHILPGCDHGSNSMDTSLQQVIMAQKAGIKIICATSHFYPHKENADHFLIRREKSYSELADRLAERDNVPEILLGAEVLVCEGIENMEHIERLCLQGTKELLFEMPMYHWSNRLIESVLCLHAREDLKLIMAHGDRYPVNDVEIFIREGIQLQLNVDRLANRFKNKILLDWMKKGYVAYLGSDIHGTNVGYRNWNKCRKMQECWKNNKMVKLDEDA